jgi:CDP-glucose 4,6-dehydratase
MEEWCCTMENLDLKFWKDKKVLITGATGFKGSWLSLMLFYLGARVVGYSLRPPTDPSMFKILDLDKDIIHVENNILNLSALKEVIKAYNFDIVFHLAAQPLVIDSYKDPIGTYMTNVIGTANVLEAIRNSPTIKSVVVVTTDKCYDNKEWEWSYRENDVLGGYDPYSNSKACAELVVDSYRKSFLYNIGIATARAGNVIGGGDFSPNRLVPDCIRAINKNQTVEVRNLNSVRPWQHVLEPLWGYILLAEKLWISPKQFSEAWNFGPNEINNKTVEYVVNYLCNKVYSEINNSTHEANFLKLDSSKAKTRLNWHPKLTLDDALEMTLEWNRAKNKKELTMKQIERYLL